MVKCPKCGRDSPDQARFCRFCGAAFGGAAAGAPSPGPVATPEQRGQRLLEEAFRLSEEGRIVAAIQACEQALAVNPNSVSAHSLLGTLYERQGDRESAIREYEQVLTLSPESTVERRRLNELMGVPTARERIAISARTARLAITGAFVVILFVLLGAILFTTQRGPAAPRRAVPAVPLRAEAVAGAPAVPTQMVPVPGRAFTFGRAAIPSPTRPAQIAQAPVGARPTQPAFGQWVGPGAYLMPSGGSERFMGLSSPGGVVARGRVTPAGPLPGAVRYQGTPVVRTPAWQRARAVVPAGAALSAQAGREYYFQGDYNRAIDAYQAYLAEHPAAGPAPREELAWVYSEAGDSGRALGQYQQALSQYQADLQRGHNTEAARHGVRTCESAIKALQGR